MIPVKRIALMFLGLLLVGGLLAAQVSSGRIIGAVTDNQGTPLPGVTVEATSPKLVGKASTTTDEDGTYRLLNLAAGTYRITFALDGFQTLVREAIVLIVEQTLSLDVSLEIGTLEEEITVVGQSPLIDVKSTARGMNLTKEIFQLLPKGRNFDSLIAAIPGVVDEDFLLRGTSIDGASGDENMYYIDGVNTNSLVTGLSAQSVNLDFVDEVQVKSSGYQAEFGGSMGGVINVISRSGGNSFHGELIGYLDSSKLQSKYRDILDESQINTPAVLYYSYEDYVGKEKWNKIEGGFNLGGFILKDRLWFFGSFMPSYYKRDRTLNYAIQGSDLVRDFTRTENQYNGMFKLTSQPLQNLRISAGFINNSWKYLGDNLVEANFASSTSKYDSGWTYPNMSISGNIDLNMGNSFMMSARGGYFKTDQINPALPVGDKTPRYRFIVEQPYGYIPSANTMFPEIPAALRHSGGWSNKSATENAGTLKVLRERYNANFDATYFMQLAGEHAFKAGFQFIRQGQNVDINSSTGPTVLFAWDMDLAMSGVNYGRGKYGWYAVRGNEKAGPLGDNYNVYANNYALYVQDSWTIGPKLTINAGLRAENEYLPGYAAEPYPKKAIEFPWSKKLAPRFGFIYDVKGDSSLKIYGSFGIYQDMMKLDMAANAFGGFKWKSAYYWLEDYDYTKIGVNGNYPGKFLFTYDYRPPSFDTVDPDIKPFSQREISLGAEQKLSEDISASVRLVSKSVLTAIEDSAIYGRNAEGNWEEFYFQSNPGSDFLKKKYDEAIAGGQLAQGTPYIPKATRDYLAINISLEKRFSNRWLGGLSYTLSRLSGNYSGLVSSDEVTSGIGGGGRNNPNGERAFDLWYICYDKSLKPIDGPLPTDRPHVFKAYGSYAFPFGLVVGGIFNAMSGTPITEEWILDSDGYFPFNRGNMGRTPFLTIVNAYAEYKIKFGRTSLLISANVDNVLDVKTALRKYSVKYLDNVAPQTDDPDDTLFLQRQLISKNWVPNSDPSLLDPLFGKESNFFKPLSVRLGLRFVF